MRIFTIGFTKTSAESFFTRLQKAAVGRLVGVWLHNVSQLAGFAKKDDLRYFVEALCGAEYVHRPELAPTAELLDAYRKHRGHWATYETNFLHLIRSRRIEETISPGRPGERVPALQRRQAAPLPPALVTEYLRDKWGSVEITHL
jgi:hypothetical protein